MNNNLSYLITLTDQFSPMMKQVQASMAGMQKKMQSVKQSAQAMGDIGKNLSLKMTLPIVGVATMAIKAASSFEDYRANFGVMLKDTEKGTQFFNQIRDMASKTPFQIGDLAKASSTMLGFGISMEQILPNLQMLGDVAGADSEKLRALTLAFSQVKGTGHLMGQDLLQFINAGYNPLESLSTITGTSMATLKDMVSRGGISFEMVREAFKFETGEKGRFFQNMITQSKTFTGVWSNFKDIFNVTMAGIGETILPTIKELFGKFVVFLGKFQKFVELNPQIVKMGLALAGISALIGPLMIGFSLVAGAIAMALTPIGAIGAGIAVAIGAVGALYLKWEPFREIVNSTLKIIQSIYSILQSDTVNFGLLDTINEFIFYMKEFIKFLTNPLSPLKLISPKLGFEIPNLGLNFGGISESFIGASSDILKGYKNLSNSLSVFSEKTKFQDSLNKSVFSPESVGGFNLFSGQQRNSIISEVLITVNDKGGIIKSIEKKDKQERRWSSNLGKNTVD